MTYQFTVSPDFPPEELAGWFVFNSWLQKQINEAIHLEMYDRFEDQRAAIVADKVDLIFANAYDASMLVREKGFTAVARPTGLLDEAIIAVRNDSSVRRVEDLKPGTRVASTERPDVDLVGMIMLESADLHASNVARIHCDNYVQVAKKLLWGEADVGLFLADAFQDLSAIARNDLRILVRSEIGVVQHMLLVAPNFAQRGDEITNLLVNMNADARARSISEGIGISRWEPVAHEDVEFMIDLIDTLAG